MLRPVTRRVCLARAGSPWWRELTFSGLVRKGFGTFSGLVGKRAWGPSFFWWFLVGKRAWEPRFFPTKPLKVGLRAKVFESGFSSFWVLSGFEGFENAFWWFWRVCLWQSGFKTHLTGSFKGMIIDFSIASLFWELQLGHHWGIYGGFDQHLCFFFAWNQGMRGIRWDLVV